MCLHQGDARQDSTTTTQEEVALKTASVDLERSPTRARRNAHTAQQDSSPICALPSVIRVQQARTYGPKEALQRAAHVDRAPNSCAHKGITVRRAQRRPTGHLALLALQENNWAKQVEQLAGDVQRDDSVLQALQAMACPVPVGGSAQLAHWRKCPAGFYCPEGIRDPMPCQPGTFNPLEGQDEATDCRECYPGKACTQVALKAPDVDCMQGPNALTNACPPGTLSNRTDLTDPAQCQRCPARYACLRGTGGSQRPPLSCFPGHYCPPGTMFPTQHKCPEGTWSERSGLEAEGECRPCPRGWYCLAGVWGPTGSTKMGNGQREDCHFCPGGSYCPEGTSKPTPCPPSTFRRLKGGQSLEDCSVCPAGYFCPLRATISPRVCGAGSYSDKGSVECFPCLQGHYCSNETTSEEAMLSVMVCPPGFLCSQGLAREPQRSAILCPRGFYCPGGGIDPNPIPCPNGTFSRQPGLRDLTECAECPVGKYCYSQQPQEQPIIEPGFYCSEGSTVPRPCEEGTYSSRPALSDVSECAPCGGGRYCSGVGRTGPSGDCGEGFYCRERASSATPSDGPTGSNNTSPTGLCSAGFYCTGGSASPAQNEAEEGHYTLEGAVRPEPCPLGTFQPGRGCSSCLECQRGRLCNQKGMSQPGLCPTGHYCPPGYAGAHPCPPGSYADQPGREEVQHCSPCDAGWFCRRAGLSAPQGLCDPGFYCTSGATTATPVGVDSGDVCPVGYFCPLGTRFPHEHPCPAGTWSNAVGTQGLSSCWPCLPGLYCATECLECPPGRYCLEGEGVQLCPKGFYCLGGTVEDVLPCPPGTYSQQPGQSQLEQCLLCPAGFEGRGGREGGGRWGGLCPPAHYCSPGSAIPVPCPAGTYASLTGQTQCPRCHAGYYCPERTSNYTLFPCPPGFYCPDGTRHATQFPCPRGYYNPEPMTQSLDSCLPCPPGHYCQRVATALACPAAHYCPHGSAVPEPCPSGTFQDREKQATCNICEEGYYCDLRLGLENASVLRPCPKGHYCPRGTALATQNPCPPGSFNPRERIDRLTGCMLCPPGQFCPTMGLAEPAGYCNAGFWCREGAYSPSPVDGLSGFLCPAGQYCPSGTPAPVPCPLGTWSNSTGLANQEECQPCPGGLYCDSNSLTAPTGPCTGGYYCLERAVTPTPTDGSTGGPCLEGHYCPVGTTQPLPCDPGTYMIGTHATECEPCTPGWYCVSGTLQLCPAGFYCHEGTGYDLRACPEGTYSPELGLTSISQCRQCDGGHYCPLRNGTSVTGQCLEGYYCSYGNTSPQPPSHSAGGGPCPAGHYCPRGTINPQPCPIGTFSNLTKLVSQRLQGNAGKVFTAAVEQLSPTALSETAEEGRVHECIAGYLCHSGAVSPTPEDGVTGDRCPQGHYCPEGLAAAPRPCPLGYYSNTTRNTQLSDCLPCPAGFICASRGLSLPSHLCQAGSYCPYRHNSSLPGSITCSAGHMCPLGSAIQVPCVPGTYQDQPGQAHSLVWSTHAQLARLVGRPARLIRGGVYPALQGSTAALQGWQCLLGNALLGTFVSKVLLLLSQLEILQAPFWVDMVVNQRQTVFTVWREPLSQHNAQLAVGGADSATPQANSSQLSCLCGMIELHPTNQDLCSWLHNTSCSPNSKDTGRSGGSTVDDCQPCPPGHYCNQTGLAEPSGQCAAGYYCPGGQSTDRPSQHVCGVGHFCEEGSVRERACVPGSYQPSEGQHQCEGEFPPVVRAVQGLCVLGPPLNHPPQTTSQELHVLLDSTVLLGAPYHCPALKAHSGSQSAAPMSGVFGGVCNPGHYCESGSSVPASCPAGTHHNDTGGKKRDDCKPCPDGWFQDLEGQRECKPCPPGFHCLTTNTTGSTSGPTTPLLCPAGYVCPRESSFSQPYPCPKGTYNPTMGLTSPGECLVCPAGQFCGSEGLVEPTGPCAPGFLCVTRATVPNPADNRTGSPCPPGAYCQLGLRAGACSPGFFCDWGSSSPEEALCPAGCFCPGGTRTPLACPAGTHSSVTGNSHQNNCTTCPDGYYCQGEGVVHPVLCPLGHYCPPGLAVGVRFPCPPGTVQSKPGASSLDHCLPCPAGHRCPVGTASEVPCEPGTYSPAPGAAHCLTCPNGTMCPSSATQEPSLCPADSCSPCPPGHYCSIEGLASPSGLCAAGFYCPFDFSSTTPYAFLCPKESTSPTQALTPASPAALASTPCPNGTFTPADLEGLQEERECLPCLPGRFCRYGFYCPEGSEKPEICPENTIRVSPGAANIHDCLAMSTTALVQKRSTPGAASKGDCHPCPPGSYCNSTDYSGYPCPPGYWCSGTGLPILCPAGTMRPLPGAAAASQCEPCAGGTYCPDPMSTGQPNIAGISCRASYQCPPGSSAMLSCEGGSVPLNTSGPRAFQDSSCGLCEAGTYRPRLSPQPHCLTCPPGYHCPPGTEHYHSNPCPLGYVCPLGSSSPVPCPPGSFGNLSNAEHLEDCYPCPPDTFNHLAAQRACFPCGSSSTAPQGLIKQVNKRCSAGQVRLAASRDCHCEHYVSAEELCNTSCLSRLPHISARLSPDGQLLLGIKEPDESRAWSR
ncbi:unnamed protein product, partial [Coregonus sp. 'balchen']